MAIFHSIWLYALSFGTLGVIILLALFAPSVLPVLAEFLKPVAKALGGVFGWLINVVKVGIQDILDTWQTMVTVVLLVIGVMLWMAPVYDDAHCKQVIQHIHAKYKLIPRTGAVDYTLPWWSRWF